MDALALGLIDGFGSVGYVARTIEKNSNVVDFTEKQSVLEQLTHGVGSTVFQQLNGYKGMSEINIK